MASQEQPKPVQPGIGAALKGDIVVVKVGPDHTAYKVAKALLTYHSDYFRRAWSGDWKEAEDGVVVLDDFEPATFEMFLLLLYGGVIPGHHCRDEDHGAAWFRMTGLPYGEEADYGNIRVLEILLLKLYILCDRLGAIDLKKVAKNGILRTFDRMPGTKNIIHAFENLPPNDVVLDFLVYMKCAYYDPSRDCPKTRESNEKLPAHALVRIMHRFGEMTKIQSEDEEYCARKEFCARFHDRDTESEESMCKQCQELDEGLDCERCRKELETMKEGLSAKETESL